MNNSFVDDPWLELPLAGLHLIEASAGTGKTFTVATLFTRLVVEKTLRMGQILTVTFTEAATQELRTRIRERLAQAARWVGRAPEPGQDSEEALTCAILQRHQHDSDESNHALRQRLRQAAEETDLAAIFTIHSFCARVLREYALESRHTLATTELLTDTQALHAEIAADIWRRYSSQKVYLETLTGLWKTPEALAEQISQLAGELPLYPPRPDTFLAEPKAELDAAADTLLRAIADHFQDAQATIRQALEKDVFKKNSGKAQFFAKAFAELKLGCSLRYWSLGKDSYITKLAANELPGICKKNKPVPASPLFDALQIWVDAYALKQAWLKQKKIIFLHRVRQEIHQQLAEYKQQQRVQIYDDLITNLANALQGEAGHRLARSLRKQYKVALVDEFQDTDARQWQIFRQLFADPGSTNETALFLIGDPKQAIYGFRGGDIHTYLHARSQAAKAPPLNRNFRSRPALLRALQCLYETAGNTAFGSAPIQFEPVLPGDKLADTHYLRHGQAATALHIGLISADKPDHVEAARAAVTSACVQHIYHLLSDARKGQAFIKDKEGTSRPVSSGDIAVLVRNHKEAVLIQRALTQLGIAAVASGRQSLFATEQAQEIRGLLLALLHPSDEGRLRAALSSVLLGYDAAALAALDRDRQQQHEAQHRLLQWRARWQRSGIFALLADICAQQAPRLLSLVDGERRLSNTLQLAQVLQQASRHSLGLNSLLDWLHNRIFYANNRDDEQQLHLESDARCVQVVTLHKSKGLEYPLVYLPFVGIDTGGKEGDFVIVHDGSQRALHWKIDARDLAWQVARDQAKEESRNEDARLLYVGLTRAQQALWLAAGALTGFEKSALAALLGDAQANALASHADIEIYNVPINEPALPRLPPEQETSPLPPRRVHRHLAQDWWVYSFTQLAHADGTIERTAIATQASGRASDEIATSLAEELDSTSPPSFSIEKTQEQKITEAHRKLFSGSRFGNVLHSTLETTDFAAWANWQPGQQAPEGQREPITRALYMYGYEASELEAGVSVVTELIGQTLTVSLPEGGALHTLPPDQRRAEIEFHFAMQPVAVPELLHLLHAHGIVRQRQGFGVRRQLEGLMTGKIDLTYTRAGRWYVLDYKSNQLPDYRAEPLAAAMQHSEYDLQGVIYTLALHRWLRFRLGNTYDYARHFGGIRYLFCRGLDARCDPSPGVYAHCFSAELVNELDALFGGNHQ